MAIDADAAENALVIKIVGGRVAELLGVFQLAATPARHYPLEVGLAVILLYCSLYFYRYAHRKNSLAFSLLAVALIIVAEGTLAFLGVGLKSTIASWGTLITQGRNDLRRYPHVVMMPSIVLVLTVLSLNVVGEKLRSRFDVRESAV